MNIPPYFNTKKLETFYRVPYLERAEDAREWKEKYDITPSSTDKEKVALLLIDVQNTFCLPEFELYVGGRSGRGAIEDNVRLCEFIYKNLGKITSIFPTLDTHAALQIFHPLFWVDAEGHHPTPSTIIQANEVRTGKWKVSPRATTKDISHEELSKYALHYVEKLAKDEKYPLIIWPYHAMQGGIGHALVSSVEEAIFFHSIARSSKVHMEIKGDNFLTENYSVLAPEVRDDHNGKTIATKNTAFVETLLTYDKIIIAGQAKSHCVAWTIDDLLSEIRTRDPLLAEKVYLLDDCSSAVVIPGVVDFTDDAERAYERFADAGMNRVTTDNFTL
ncbi:MAG: isochorismatase [Candidatus Gracilibacteria bacterium]